jgi:proline racemase
MRDKTAWMATHGDAVRRTLMLEPRGHADMTGAMLTEPVAPGSHAGLVFMNAVGYPAMSGHSVLAASVVALERGLVTPGGDGQSITIDTAAGTVRILRGIGDGDTGSSRASFTNVPSFVLHAGVTARVAGRQIRADVAYGGVFYAIVDAESAGVAVDLKRAPFLRDLGREVADAIESSIEIVHPLDAAITGLAGTLFTGPPTAGDAQLRNVTVLTGGSTGRGPSGTGMSAVMAVLAAMELLGDHEPFVQEGLSGAVFQGRIVSRTTVGHLSAIVPEISGEAWITGDHVFHAAPDDPYSLGLPS